MRDIVSPISGFRSPFDVGAPDYSEQDAAILGESPVVWLDVSNVAYLWQNTARSTAVASTNDPIGGVTDRSVNGNHAFQGNATERSLWNGSGAVFDGVNDALDFPVSTRTTDMTSFIVVEVTDTVGFLYGAAVSGGWLSYFSAGNNASTMTNAFGTPTVHVNNASIATVGAYQTALNAGELVIAEVRGHSLTQTGGDVLRLGKAFNGSFQTSCRVASYVLLNSSDSTKLATVRNALASKHGVTL